MFRISAPVLARTGNNSAFVSRLKSSQNTVKHCKQDYIDKGSHVVRSPYTDVPLPQLNVGEYIWRNSDRWKHWPALTCSATGRSFTFGEARAACERLSISLPATLGLKQGDVVGVVLPNMPEYAITFLGATSAGLIVSPANPLYTEEELARQFENAGVKAVVTNPELAPKVQQALSQVPGGGGPLVLTTGGPEGNDLFSLDELMNREFSRRTPRPARPDPDSVVALPYSSGTTGLPKGVVILHRNMVANLCQLEHPNVLSFPKQGAPQDVAVGVLPLFHIYGLNGLLNVGLSVGRHTITVPKFEPKPFASIFSTYKPTVLALVPPLVMFLTQSDLVTSTDLSRVRFISCGAAPATKSLIEQFMEKAQCSELDFREGYGLTETSCAACFVPSWSGLDKIGSCGVPLPLTEIKVVDEQGQALPLGQTGELWLRGPQVMQGYWRNEKATKETLTSDGWLMTGDICYLDDEGYVFIVDRLKELIKVKGLQVSPTELEGVLRKMDGVSDVAVIGVPDARSGEVPKAFVVRKPGSNIAENDVTAFVEGHVAEFKKLAGGVKFVDEIPKNAAGKILRKNLKNL
ncbi:uncharacterized protein LOC132200818 [Neocloeon triangulifer]|uniref:uncharacterized protein LOC132200818 n=1 Tax=Neocloeon triangulifer TaxID=2078957 RepID=UPI00286FAAC7|nr:uncharacterized protein LOC132200818 [Neocloeon triangulifer]